jgi:hypothetical protein
MSTHGVDPSSPKQHAQRARIQQDKRYRANIEEEKTIHGTRCEGWITAGGCRVDVPPLIEGLGRSSRHAEPCDRGDATGPWYE